MYIVVINLLNILNIFQDIELDFIYPYSFGYLGINIKESTIIIFLIILILYKIFINSPINTLGVEYLYKKPSGSVNPVGVLFEVNRFILYLKSKYSTDKDGGGNPVETTIFIRLFIIALLFIIITQELIMFYLAIEIMSILSYLLILNKRTSDTQYFTILYFLLGNFSSLLLLFGIYLIYNTYGTLNFTSLYSIINSAIELNYNSYGLFGFYLILIALIFKLGLFPFHTWLLQIYPILDLKIFLILLTFPKFVILCFLLKLFNFSILFNNNTYLLLFFIISFSLFFSMFLGLTFHFNQIRRILSLSSILNISQLLIFFLLFIYFDPYSYFQDSILTTPEFELSNSNYDVVYILSNNFFFYLFFYFINTILTVYILFCLQDQYLFHMDSLAFLKFNSNTQYNNNSHIDLIHTKTPNRTHQRWVGGVSGYLSINPTLNFILFLSILSLIGIFPFVGFYFKFFLFSNLLSTYFQPFFYLLSFLILSTFFTAIFYLYFLVSSIKSFRSSFRSNPPLFFSHNTNLATAHKDYLKIYDINYVRFTTPLPYLIIIFFSFLILLFPFHFPFLNPLFSSFFL